jgi:hypothetical protein
VELVGLDGVEGGLGVGGGDGLDAERLHEPGELSGPVGGAVVSVLGEQDAEAGAGVCLGGRGVGDGGVHVDHSGGSGCKECACQG